MARTVDDDTSMVWAARCAWAVGVFASLLLWGMVATGYRPPFAFQLLVLATAAPAGAVAMALGNHPVAASHVRVREGVLMVPLAIGEARIDLRRLRTVDAWSWWGRTEDVIVVKLADDADTVRFHLTGRHAVSQETYEDLWHALAVPGVPATDRGRELLQLPGWLDHPAPRRSWRALLLQAAAVLAVMAVLITLLAWFSEGP